MTPYTALGAEDTVALLGIARADKPACLALLANPVTPGVECVMAHLASQLGSSEAAEPELGASAVVATELDWITGMMRFVPDLLVWHRARHIPEAVTVATLADFGRNMAINRRVHQRFGMDTYLWLGHVFAGRLYHLGRLQYLLHRPKATIPGVVHDEWIVGLHIPEDGGLSVTAVRESLAQAAAFFAQYFPQQPVRTANCESWLLDPYLREHLDPTSNIARFAALFTPYGEPRDEPTDAVYFTFRTRIMNHLDQLPRTTTLQRLVLERIAAGGIWQVGCGTVALPREATELPTPFAVN